MKKILLSTLLLIIGLTTYAAVWQSQGEAEITFEKTTHNFGSFPESSPKVTCVFKFKNSGDGPLVISFFPFVRIVIDFLKCPGNLPAPL